MYLDGSHPANLSSNIPLLMSFLSHSGEGPVQQIMRRDERHMLQDCIWLPAGAASPAAIVLTRPSDVSHDPCRGRASC